MVSCCWLNLDDRKIRLPAKSEATLKLRAAAGPALA